MYSGPSETSKMELFVKIVDFIQPLTILHFILGVSEGHEYASDKTKQKVGALTRVSEKIRTFFHF